jgi:hypothetical protein
LEGFLWVEAQPGRPYLTLASQEGRILQWNAARGGVRQLAQVGRLVQTRWSPDGNWLVAVLREGQALFFDASGQQRESLAGEFETLSCVGFDGTRLALGGSRGGQARALVGSLKTGWKLEYEVVCKQAQEVRSLVLHEDTLVLGCEDGFFEAYREGGQKNPAGGQIFTGAVSAMDLSPERTHIALGGNRGGVLTMAMDPWIVADSWPRVPPRPIAVNQVSFVEGSLLLACSDDCARIFDWPKPVSEGELGTPFWLRQPKPEWSQQMIIPSLCALGQRIYLAHYTGGLSCWDAQERRLLGRLLIDGAGHWKIADEEGQGETPSRVWQSLH